VRLAGDQWRTFFDTFQHTAFRLETRPVYDVASEQDEYKQFLSSGSLSIPNDDPWLTRVRHFRATGRWIGRVHVLRRPLTDYLRYEFAVYRHTATAGEDIGILDITSQPNPGLPDQDFWLLDSTSVVRMDYDGQGRQLGRELLEDTDPAPYAEWQRIALAHAQPFTEYVKLLGQRAVPHLRDLRPRHRDH
jgi:hypothetical protein